jgi:hypothetical protein
MVVFDFNSLIDSGQVTFGKILKRLANAHPAKNNVRVSSMNVLTCIDILINC